MRRRVGRWRWRGIQGRNGAHRRFARAERWRGRRRRRLPRPLRVSALHIVDNLRRETRCHASSKKTFSIRIHSKFFRSEKFWPNLTYISQEFFAKIKKKFSIRGELSKSVIFQWFWRFSWMRIALLVRWQEAECAGRRNAFVAVPSLPECEPIQSLNQLPLPVRTKKNKK